MEGNKCVRAESQLKKRFNSLMTMDLNTLANRSEAKIEANRPVDIDYLEGDGRASRYRLCDRCKVNCDSDRGGAWLMSQEASRGALSVNDLSRPGGMPMKAIELIVLVPWK
jgi:hypothetical protein